MFKRKRGPRRRSQWCQSDRRLGPADHGHRVRFAQAFYEQNRQYARFVAENRIEKMEAKQFAPFPHFAIHRLLTASVQALRLDTAGRVPSLRSR